MRGTRLRSSGICKGSMQRPLHQGSEGFALGVASTRQKARGRVRRMWKADWSKGRVGVVSTALQTGSIRDIEGCGCFCVRRQVRPLRRVISQSGVRFPSSWRQGWLSERDVHKPINANTGKGISQVQSTVRELSQAGAPR